MITLPVLEITSRCNDHPEHALTLPLRDPIGDRVLIDGSTGEPRWQDGMSVPPAGKD